MLLLFVKYYYYFGNDCYFKVRFWIISVTNQLKAISGRRPTYYYLTSTYNIKPWIFNRRQRSEKGNDVNSLNYILSILDTLELKINFKNTCSREQK